MSEDGKIYFLEITLCLRLAPATAITDACRFQRCRLHRARERHIDAALKRLGMANRRRIGTMTRIEEMKMTLLEHLEMADGSQDKER